jgi:hypothetical protein
LSQNLRKFVNSRHEAVQILHHAYTWDANGTILVVGDDDGKIIWGITVVFEKKIREAYGAVIDAIYDFTFPFAYHSESRCLPTHDLCLEQAAHSLNINWDELDQNFGMINFQNSL